MPVQKSGVNPIPRPRVAQIALMTATMRNFSEMADHRDFVFYRDVSSQQPWNFNLYSDASVALAFMFC